LKKKQKKAHSFSLFFLPPFSHLTSLSSKQVIKRTEGVSSTDIVGRMLMRTPPENKGPMSSSKGGKKNKNDFFYPAEALAKQFSAGDPEALAMLGSSPPSTSTGAAAVAAAEAAERAASEAPTAAEEASSPSAEEIPPPTPRGAPPTAVSRFLPTTRRIVQFSAGAAAARPGDRVVYLDGAFDLFHPGHVAALKAARALGDFLLVGVHSDEDVRARRGVGRPIMDLHERALSVLACRFVNEVVIGAPAVLTDDLLTTFNVAVVARGTTTETGPPSASTSSPSLSPSDFAFSTTNSNNWQRRDGFSRGPSMTSLSAPPSRAHSPVPLGVLEALGAPPSPRKADDDNGDGGNGDRDGESSAAPPSASEAAAVAAAAAEVSAAVSASAASAEQQRTLNGNNSSNSNLFLFSDERRYAVARAKGILREFRSPSTLTAAAVVDRIVAHREQFERRNAKKAAAEAAYYKESKTYVAEK